MFPFFYLLVLMEGSRGNTVRETTVVCNGAKMCKNIFVALYVIYEELEFLVSN